MWAESPDRKTPVNLPGERPKPFSPESSGQLQGRSNAMHSFYQVSALTEPRPGVYS